VRTDRTICPKGQHINAIGVNEFGTRPKATTIGSSSSEILTTNVCCCSTNTAFQNITKPNAFPSIGLFSLYLNTLLQNTTFLMRKFHTMKIFTPFMKPMPQTNLCLALVFTFILGSVSLIGNSLYATDNGDLIEFNEDGLDGSECQPNVTVNNDGPCQVAVYHWTDAGDVWVGSIQPYSSKTFNTAADGEKYRIMNVNPDFNAPLFDQHYLVSGCHDQTVNAASNYCNVCNANMTVNNNGNCEVCIYEWYPSGDILIATIPPGGSQNLHNLDEGLMLRATNCDWNNLLFDESFTRVGCKHQTWNLNPNYCGAAEPPAPNCGGCSNNFIWDNNVSLVNGSYESDFRLRCGVLESSQLISLPATFHNGMMDIEVPSYVSADGYTGRSSASQNCERWKVEYYKNGVLVGETNQTTDVPDGQDYAWSTGSLNTVNLSNGATHFKIVHTGCWCSGVQSVVPSGLCFCKVDLTPECVISCPPNVTINCNQSALPANTGTATAGGNNCGSPTITYSDSYNGNSCPQVITRTWTATGESTETNCFPQTVASYHFDNIPTCQNPLSSGGIPVSSKHNLACASVSASNVTGADDGSSCVQGAFGTPETAICVMDQDDPQWSDNNDDAVHFNVTFNSSQSGQLTEFCFYERVDEYNENFGYNDPPQRWGMRVLKNGAEIFQDIGNTTSYGHWTQRCFDFSNNPNFAYNGSTVFKIELMGYQVNDTKHRNIWELDEFTVDACCASSTSTPIVETCTQTITIVDNVPPSIANVPSNVTVSCEDDVPAVPGNVTGQDNCNFETDFTETISGNQPCNYVITRTWTVTDDCGATARETQTVTVRDNIDPIASNPNPITVQCFSDVPGPDPLVVDDESDNCTTPTVTFWWAKSYGNNKDL